MREPVDPSKWDEVPMRKLSEAIREVKTAAADRDDVVVEMREAQRMRLELLVQELQPVLDDVPADNPMFDFALSSGEQPRFWIDAVAHVTMGRDKRTYRFLRDTRLGRTVLAESSEIGPVADQVTRYIAERIVERERALDTGLEVAPRGAGLPAQVHEAPAPGARNGWRANAMWVLFGALIGAGALIVAYWDQLGLTRFNP